jgi:hypothetical protein
MSDRAPPEPTLSGDVTLSGVRARIRNATTSSAPLAMNSRRVSDGGRAG